MALKKVRRLEIGVGHADWAAIGNSEGHEGVAHVDELVIPRAYVVLEGVSLVLEVRQDSVNIVFVRLFVRQRKEFDVRGGVAADGLSPRLVVSSRMDPNGASVWNGPRPMMGMVQSPKGSFGFSYAVSFRASAGRDFLGLTMGGMSPCAVMTVTYPIESSLSLKMKDGLLLLSLAFPIMPLK